MRSGNCSGRGLAWVVVVAITSCSMGAETRSQTMIDRVRHGDWDGCWRLSNGTAEVIVAPQVGRVVSYRLIGGPNLLWQQPKAVEYAPKFGGWVNWGGEKAWLWPQDAWKWPPPKAIDGLPYAAEARDGKVLLCSEVEPKFGVRIVREIGLASTGTAVTTLTSIEAARDLAQPVGAWTVTQVSAPPQLLALLAPGAEAGTAMKPMSSAPWPAAEPAKGQWLAFTMDYRKAAKVGLEADALAATLGESVLLQRRIPAATDSEGLDRREMSQLYQHPRPSAMLPPGHPTYVELEFISASRKLKQGEAVSLSIEWSIHPLRRSGDQLVPP